METNCGKHSKITPISSLAKRKHAKILETTSLSFMQWYILYLYYLRLEEVLVQGLLSNLVRLQGTSRVTDLVQRHDSLQREN